MTITIDWLPPTNLRDGRTVLAAIDFDVSRLTRTAYWDLRQGLWLGPSGKAWEPQPFAVARMPDPPEVQP